MFNLRNILQFIIDGFNQSPFPKQELVRYAHQGVPQKQYTSLYHAFHLRSSGSLVHTASNTS